MQIDKYIRNKFPLKSQETRFWDAMYISRANCPSPKSRLIKRCLIYYFSLSTNYSYGKLINIGTDTMKIIPRKANER